DVVRMARALDHAGAGRNDHALDHWSDRGDPVGKLARPDGGGGAAAGAPSTAGAADTRIACTRPSTDSRGAGSPSVSAAQGAGCPGSGRTGQGGSRRLAGGDHLRLARVGRHCRARHRHLLAHAPPAAAYGRCAGGDQPRRASHQLLATQPSL
ncbi:MAG: hypothetical protein AVDCRST_MAG23-2572, partial [uncultured Sphingosinicella sp.]